MGKNILKDNTHTGKHKIAIPKIQTKNTLLRHYFIKFVYGFRPSVGCCVFELWNKI